MTANFLSTAVIAHNYCMFASELAVGMPNCALGSIYPAKFADCYCYGTDEVAVIGTFIDAAV